MLISRVSFVLAVLGGLLSQDALGTEGRIETFAGGLNGSLAVQDTLSAPGAVSVDTSGAVLIADTNGHRVKKRDSNNNYSTLAGDKPGFSGDLGPGRAASLAYPSGIAADSSGNIYIADSYNNRIRRLDSLGRISTFAGSGEPGFSGDGIQAAQASLNFPTDVAISPGGVIYIADSRNHRIRSVDANGVISTIAGNGSAGYSGDGGPAVTASFNNPTKLTVSAQGVVYVADTDNHRIRKIDLSGGVVSVAGDGLARFAGDGGPATSASLNTPMGVSLDSAGRVYVADSLNHRVRVIISGVISTFGGTGVAGFSGDGGPATQAAFNLPKGLSRDSSGNLYVADFKNARVRRIDSKGNIASVAGTGVLKACCSDEWAPASRAVLSKPFGVASLGPDTYISDTYNHRIVKVNAAGVVTTVAGSGLTGFSGDGGKAVMATMSLPHGIALDKSGNLYITDWGNARIRKVTPSGIISTVAGNGVRGYTGDGVQATSTGLQYPEGVVIDSDGNLLIADTYNQRIRKVSVAGVISTIAGDGYLLLGMGRLSGEGGPATRASLNYPSGLALDTSGNIYIADTRNHVIRKIDPAGIISRVAGTGVPGPTGDLLPATLSSLNQPMALAVGTSGIYVADTANHRIRKIDASGIITTVAGSGVPLFFGDGGSAGLGGVAYPSGLAILGEDLLIADHESRRIRRLVAQL